MKTIYVKDLANKLLHGKKMNWKKVIPTAVFLLAMFVLGQAAAETLAEMRRTAGQAAEQITEQTARDTAEGKAEYTESQIANGTVSEYNEISEKSENWGLGFGKSGEKPTGNATISEMKKYNAYYMAEGDEKVIYLTFDCGYENGNTEPILDALKKRELIKLHVLDNCEYSAAEAAAILAEKSRSEVVQVIGSRFVLFKRNPQNPVISLKD